MALGILPPWGCCPGLLAVPGYPCAACCGEGRGHDGSPWAPCLGLGSDPSSQLLPHPTPYPMLCLCLQLHQQPSCSPLFAALPLSPLPLGSGWQAVPSAPPASVRLPSTIHKAAPMPRIVPCQLPCSSGHTHLTCCLLPAQRTPVSVMHGTPPAGRPWRESRQRLEEEHPESHVVLKLVLKQNWSCAWPNCTASES